MRSNGEGARRCWTWPRIAPCTSKSPPLSRLEQRLDEAGRVDAVGALTPARQAAPLAASRSPSAARRGRPGGAAARCPPPAGTPARRRSSRRPSARGSRSRWPITSTTKQLRAPTAESLILSTSVMMLLRAVSAPMLMSVAGQVVVDRGGHAHDRDRPARVVGGWRAQRERRCVAAPAADDQEPVDVGGRRAGGRCWATCSRSGTRSLRAELGARPLTPSR